MSRTTVEMPVYYIRLHDYFPAEELKHPRHLQELVSDHPNYHKQEAPQYLLLYADFGKFLFVDYLLVNSAIRGQGIGGRVLRQLQARALPIILEVEPEDDEVEDTARRRNFYHRHGFRPAKNILYERQDKDGDYFSMDIWCWAPRGHQLDDDVIHRMMSKVCDSVHNHNAMAHYGRYPALPEEVLTLKDA